MRGLSDRDVQNRLEGWNTVGRLPGCQENSESPSPGHARDCQCPPYSCDDCGTTQPQTEPCGCFTGFEGMALADIKGHLAACELSLGLISNGDER